MLKDYCCEYRIRFSDPHKKYADLGIFFPPERTNFGSHSNALATSVQSIKMGVDFFFISEPINYFTMEPNLQFCVGSEQDQYPHLQ